MVNILPRFLCVCQYGHSRSVAMARTLHGMGYYAMAAGVGTTDSEGLSRLAGWADKILVMQPHFANRIDPAYLEKVVVMDVGHDQWSNPYNRDLLALCRRLVDEKLELVDMGGL